VTEDIISQELTCIFHEIFDDPTIIIRRDLTADGVEDWDSVNHVRLIVAIEERFGISFSTAEVAELTDVGELIDLILIHLTSQRRLQ
jgi:acyl carrier protein